MYKNQPEYKAINFEVKDLDKGKREAVIAHATYNSMDRVKDISRKGMFTKSWKESKEDIGFLLNHDENQTPGKILDVWEDDEHAYTKAFCGTHTLGNDTLIMMDEGVIKKASFGYIVEKKSYIEVKGQKVRELKEVKHLETSVLTKLQAHPDSKVISVTKAFEQMGVEFKYLSTDEQAALKRILTGDQSVLEELVRISGTLDVTSDLYTWISWNIERRSSMIGDIRYQLKWNSGELKAFKQHIETMENFCRNTKASDDCIKSIQLDIKQAKEFLSGDDTAGTPDGEPAASKDEMKSFADSLRLLTLKHL
jgi:HK97 family phage prohead protease